MGRKYYVNWVQCVLVSVVLVITMAIFYANYRDAVQFIEDEYKIHRDLVEKSITSSLQRIDLTSRLFDDRSTVEKEKNPLMGKYGISPSLSHLSQQYPSVDEVKIYRFNRQGTTLRAIGPDVQGDIGVANEGELRELLQTVLRDQRIREFITREEEPGSGRTLRYIPHQSALPNGEIDWCNSFVAAITYNDRELAAAIARQQNTLLANCLMLFMVFWAMMASLDYFLQQAEASREQLASVVNLTSEGYCLLGLDLRLRDVNESLCKMTGYSREELLAMPLCSLLPSHAQEAGDGPRMFSDLEGWRNRERVLAAKGGRHMYVVINATQVMDGHCQPQYAFAFFHDITARKQNEEYIGRMAYHDPLTDLPNRKLFYEKLSQELARCRRNETMLAVMFVDMDHFKSVNDTYGHETGDLLLCEVADRLKSAVRESDTVARMGGDEFTLLVTDLRDESDAVVIANKIMDIFRKPARIHGQLLTLHCSVGVSLFPRDGEQAESLVRNADAAMYSVKSLGRNHWRIFEGEERKQLS